MPLVEQNSAEAPSKCGKVGTTEMSLRDDQESKEQCGKVQVSSMPFKDVTPCHDPSLGQNIWQANCGRKGVFFLMV